MDWRTPQAYQVLNILHRQETTRRKLAIDQHLFDALVGEVDLLEQPVGLRFYGRAGAIAADCRSRAGLRALSHDCHGDVVGLSRRPWQRLVGTSCCAGVAPRAGYALLRCRRDINRVEMVSRKLSEK